MHRTPVIIGKISPTRANSSLHRRAAKMSCFTLKGLIFDIDRRRSIHYPAYYKATCQDEKITSHGVSFYNLFVSSIQHQQ